MKATAILSSGPYVAGVEYDVVENPNETLGETDICITVSKKGYIVPKAHFTLSEDYELRNLKGDPNASQSSGNEGSGESVREGGSEEQEP